jgi:hypothetical protein
VTARTILTLAGIVLVVAGLSAVKFARRVEAPAPSVSGALPRILDFGRDT